MNSFVNKNNFIYFMMLLFVFISTTSISISKSFISNVNDLKTVTFSSGKLPDNPVLKEGSSFPIISAQGSIAVDLDSGVSLYEKNSDAILLPASTTKIITALVSLDTYTQDEVLTVPQGVKVDGQKMGLYPGEQMRFKDLLSSLLVYSANDAAMTLALDYPGGYDAFIAAMNSKAEELSMENTHFENPVGLDGLNQTTTAKDLMRASEVAMRIPLFTNIVGSKSIYITDVSGRSKYNLKNVNILLGEVPGVLGIKTGWTENARENLVSYVERDGHKVIIVILGSQDRFGETRELIDWIFSSYDWQEVKTPIAPDNNLMLQQANMR